MTVKYECKSCKKQFTDEKKGQEHELLCFERKGVAQSIATQMNALVKMGKKYGVLFSVEVDGWETSSVKGVRYRLPQEFGWQCPYVEIDVKDDQR